MNSIETQHIISRLAESFLISGKQARPLVNGQKVEGLFSRLATDGVYAMYFKIDYDLHNYGYDVLHLHHPEWERHYRKIIHIIVTQTHNVFSAVTAASVEEAPLKDWQNPSNHDSCWSSDGLRAVHNVAAAAYDHCFAWMDDVNRPAPALTNPLVQFSRWHFGRPPFEIVKVKGIYDAPAYRYLLSSIQKCGVQLNIVDVEAV